jgi:hypothetical protein
MPKRTNAPAPGAAPMAQSQPTSTRCTRWPATDCCAGCKIAGIVVALSVSGPRCATPTSSRSTATLSCLARLALSKAGQALALHRLLLIPVHRVVMKLLTILLLLVSLAASVVDVPRIRGYIARRTVIACRPIRWRSQPTTPCPFLERLPLYCRSRARIDALQSQQNFAARQHVPASFVGHNIWIRRTGTGYSGQNGSRRRAGWLPEFSRRGD